jgi:hypothetical protein
MSAVRHHQVRRAVLDPRRGQATVWLSGGRQEEVAVPPGSALADRLSAAGARVKLRDSGGGSLLPSVVLWLAAAALAGALLLRLRRQRRREIKTSGPDAPVEPSPARRPEVRFADVAGARRRSTSFASS